MCCSSLLLLISETSIFSCYAALNIAQRQAQYQVIIAGHSDSNSPAQKIKANLPQTNVVLPTPRYLVDYQSPGLAESWHVRTYPPITSLTLNQSRTTPLADAHHRLDHIDCLQFREASFFSSSRESREKVVDRSSC